MPRWRNWKTHRPQKLGTKVMRVRGSLGAPTSTGYLVQLAERRSPKPEVAGSRPAMPATAWRSPRASCAPDHTICALRKAGPRQPNLRHAIGRSNRPRRANSQPEIRRVAQLAALLLCQLQVVDLNSAATTTPA